MSTALATFVSSSSVSFLLMLSRKNWLQLTWPSCSILLFVSSSTYGDDCHEDRALGFLGYRNLVLFTYSEASCVVATRSLPAVGYSSNTDIFHPARLRVSSKR